MKLNKLQHDENAFIGWIIGPSGWAALAGVAVTALLIWYLDDAGFFDSLVDVVVDFGDLLMDGDDLGEWIAGILIGIISALFNWGTEIGADLT